MKTLVVTDTIYALQCCVIASIMYCSELYHTVCCYVVSSGNSILLLFIFYCIFY